MLPPPLPLPTADELPQEVRDMLASGEPAFSALADAAVSVEGMTVSDAAGKLAAAAAGMTIDEPPPEPPETPPGRRLLEIPDGRTLAALLVAASPSEHSSRALGLVSPAKDQGKTCNSCGAFAAIAVLESAVMAARARLGLGGAQAAPDYSEAHYFYCQMGQFCGCAGLKIQQWGQALVGYANSDLRDERCMPYTDAVTTAAGSLGACVQASLAPCPGGVPVVGAGFGAVSVEPVPAAGGAAWPLGSQALAQAQFRAQVQAQVRASGAALTAMMVRPRVHNGASGAHCMRGPIPSAGKQGGSPLSHFGAGGLRQGRCCVYRRCAAGMPCGHTTNRSTAAGRQNHANREADD